VKPQRNSPRRSDDDPVVREVRAVRQKLWKQAGGTIDGYLRLMDARTTERAASTRRTGRRRKSA
jgi:hypothetical protein